MSKIKVRESKRINGILYRVHGTSRTKGYAYGEAKELRKIGYLARVVIEEDKHGKLFIIFTKKK